MIDRKNYTIALMVHVIFVRETIVPRIDHKRMIFVDFLIALFTRNVNITVFMNGNFDLFDIMCKQNHKSVLNPF